MSVSLKQEKPKGKLFDVVKAYNDGQTLEKAATSYEVGGNLTRTDGVNLWDSIVKEGDLLSKIRKIYIGSNTGNLNQFENGSIFSDRAGAAAAMAEVIAGTAITGTNKRNIGNSWALKERYLLFDLLNEEITNMARLGRGVFNRETSGQIDISFSNHLEGQLITGDGTGVNMTGILKRCLDNLAADEAEELTGLKVRHFDTAAMTTSTAIYKAAYEKQQVKYRNKSVFITAENDANKYQDEVDARISYTGSKNETKKIEYPYRSRGLEVNPYMTDKTVIFTPLNNIAMVISVEKMRKNVKVQEVPYTIVYSLKVDIDYQFITNDKVVFGHVVA